MKPLAALCPRLYLLAAVAIWGCDRSDRDAPKMPLRGANATANGASGAAMLPTITGEAKTALDSGNTLFRAKAYDGALGQYRLSARLAPNELAPLLGILMVADATKDTRLGDSTLRRMRALDPAAADSATARSHADIIEGHPRTR